MTESMFRIRLTYLHCLVLGKRIFNFILHFLSCSGVKKVSDDDVPENMHKCHQLVAYVNSVKVEFLRTE